MFNQYEHDAQASDFAHLWASGAQRSSYAEGVSPPQPRVAQRTLG
jgi:hypothetical protein